MKSLIAIMVIASFFGCSKVCNEDLRVGEKVRIPLDLSNYSDNEAQVLHVWNVNGSDTTNRNLAEFLFSHSLSDNNYITDNQPNGFYSSDLDGSSLFFVEYITNDSIAIKDSLTDIVIKKSQEQVDDPCYADHPNIQIDELSFEHEGITKGKDDVVVLGR